MSEDSWLRLYYCHGVTVPVFTVKVPRNAMALKRWTLMDSRWKRKENSLGSPVDRVIIIIIIIFFFTRGIYNPSGDAIVIIQLSGRLSLVFRE